jgi:hypothetical protein
MNRPRRLAPGPRSTADRLGGGIASLSLRHRCDNEHPASGPSDSGAVRWSSSGVTLCTPGGDPFAYRNGLPRSITNRPGQTWPAASIVGPASSVPPSAPPLAPWSRAQHAVKGRALDRAPVARRHRRAFRNAGTGRDYQPYPNRPYAHLHQLHAQSRGPRLDHSALRQRVPRSLALPLRYRASDPIAGTVSLSYQRPHYLLSEYRRPEACQRRHRTLAATQTPIARRSFPPHQARPARLPSGLDDRVHCKTARLPRPRIDRSR